MSVEHINYLADLCRICGEKLSKSKASKEISYVCATNIQFLEEAFGINVEKDVKEVHPTRFCKKCHLTHSRTPVFWEPHQEEECKTCSLANFIKKGGRPSKPKRGRGKLSTAVINPKQQTQNEVIDFCQMADSAVKDIPSNRVADFGEKFSFAGEVPREYFCPVCLDILDKPVETDCQHYFCADCIKGVVTSSSVLACPLCKADSLTSIRVLTRMVINFIKDLSVICNVCGEKKRYEDCADHECGEGPVAVGRNAIPPQIALPQNQPPNQPRPVEPVAIGALVQQPAQTTEKSVQELEQEIREGKLSPEAERLGTLFVKAKLGSSTDGKTVTVKTGGKVSVLNNQ